VDKPQRQTEEGKRRHLRIAIRPELTRCNAAGNHRFDASTKFAAIELIDLRWLKPSSVGINVVRPTGGWLMHGASVELPPRVVKLIERLADTRP
jgi:hypothetical protein